MRCAERVRDEAGVHVTRRPATGRELNCATLGAEGHTRLEMLCIGVCMVPTMVEEVVDMAGTQLIRA